LQKLETATPTLATVARLANVSVASASRVLNGIKTNPETLQRVREAADAVGYVPNAAARSLRSRRTGQIAFAMPDVANPVYTTMVSSIQQAVRSHGSRLILHSTEADIADELSFLADLRQRYVDGLILVSLRFTPAHADAIAGAAVPVVVIGKPTKEAQVDTVRANSRRGAADAVRHLHSAGRRRIALVNGPEATAPGSARKLGYLDALRACELERDDALAETAVDFTIGAGREAAERLLARVRPDAIFCANDLLALGALSALRAAGLDVPRDVALVGMDNTNLSAVTWPPLTTVDLGSAERARIAAELLLARIEHPGRRARSVGVEPRLVVRSSCGASA
jgi:LacI family transcriptional regulator